MVVVSDQHDAFTSANQYHGADHVLTHRRFPSANQPEIKVFENRGMLLKSQDNLTQTLQHKGSIARRNHRPTPSGESHGRAPTIVSSVVSPTVSRNPSIQRQKRFMMSRKEVKNKFFYPVKGPKRLRSKRGKYRTKSELDASIDYINFDSSMAKDLCLNKYVTAFEFKKQDIIKIDPQIRSSIKVITVDSKNNYILYSPDPTSGKNSVIADAEQILNMELQKLGKPVTFMRTSSNRQGKNFPEYRIIRPDFHRYDTFPITEKATLIRTNSLPTKFNDAKLEALWNLYLRRVIAARIKWRLTHSSQEYLDQTVQQQEQHERKKPHRMSMASSVETGFFMNQKLNRQQSFPVPYKQSSPDDASNDESFKSAHMRWGKSSSDTSMPNVVQVGTGYESLAYSSSGDSPRRQVMLDSLEQLMNEVTSVISEI
ncbi:CYFA0S19e00430g1_1 [Cyberlindnera fabianii]|uniref:CYFA0S19e00430g1_1 n=1 Tax=Cyberlindnera fabianii TaxID=36022 RepID=A0A061B880_CYBFA|nr:CYFA0S19e00430g1_1 [Cyberlindnera fabianii]